MQNTVRFSENCLKVFNQQGEELSLARDAARGSADLAIFPGYGKPMRGAEVLAVAPVELLQSLAGHLGYKVVR